MSELASREQLRQALIYQVPDCRVAAGKICLAAMRRAGQPVEFDGDTCYYAAETFSEMCFGTVNQAGTEVSDSMADDGHCMRVQEIEANLAQLEEITGPIDQG